MSKMLLTLLYIFLFTTPLLAESADTIWVRRYNGPGNSDDMASAIALDGSGNVYVTGQSWGSGTMYDYATIKYYPDGDTGWVRKYNGPGNELDWATAIAVDKSGNVFITGASWGSGTMFDYATIKYYPNGDTAWVRTYNGPGNDNDSACAMAVDGSGNVYVTGTSVAGATGPDYTTIKYDSSGNELWVRRYNNSEGFADRARAIALDSLGNVYVTGYSISSEGIPMPDYDYATVKYDSSGNRLWVTRYNGPANNWDWALAIAVDRSANVYVTGATSISTPTPDCATIKYDSTGNQLWAKTYNGTGDYSDEGNAVRVDASGNTYVSGWTSQTGTYLDYLILKYYPNGDTAWIRTYNGPASANDVSSAMALDKAGNVYVTGWSWTAGGDDKNYDYATIKYYPDGKIAWVKRYSGPASSEDYAFAIAVDDSDKVYVTGFSTGIGTGRDYTTIKYSQTSCGDINKDGRITASDVIYLINFLFKSGPPPDPLHNADVNGDGHINVTDAVYLINYLFKGGPPPAC